ncbi:MAG: hypothetical protein HPY44_07770 [Armatimonadetes bacterium]|nr:hypothetical protein [Armatimonadota bacterium]
MTASCCGRNLPDRAVLEGVPRVGFEPELPRCPELTPFPSCLRACLEFLGEDYGARNIQAHGRSWRLDELYVYLMGTTGAAFRLSWKPGWSPDNVDLGVACNDPAGPFQRGFEAVGYGCEMLCEIDRKADPAPLTQRIMESIAREVPVLGFGVVGPPECCIITGYEEAGAALTGWSFFQDCDEFSRGVGRLPSGQFRKTAWLGDTRGLIFIGERLPAPDRAEVHRQSLYWALTISRTLTVFPDRHNGLAAYAAWAEHLGHDDEFATDDLSRLRLMFDVHDDAATTVAEGRWYAARYLEQTAQFLPWAAEELSTAANCYDREHDLVWQMWGLVGGNGRSDQKAELLAEPGVRRDAIEIINELAELDAKAVAHIDTALSDKQPW